MRAPGLALALAATACSDPSIDVTFDVPDEYEALAERVTIDVIAPGDALWQCSDLEFGEVDEAALAPSVVDQALVGPDGELGFDRVPRTGLKLFHARGYNALGQLVVAGCAAHELVDGEDEVTIEGRPAVYVSARTVERESGRLTFVSVGVSDARGTPLADVPARYRVVAANSATPVREARSDETGSLTLALEVPAWFGPQAVDIDLPWQANAIAPATSFRVPQPRFKVELDPAEGIQDLPAEQIYQVGRIGAGGEMGIALLGPPAKTGERLVHLYIQRGEQLVEVTSSPLPASALGLVAAGERDRLLVLNLDAWHEIDPDGVVVSHDESLGLAADARRIIALPTTCEPDAPRDRILVDDGSSVTMLSADLEALDSPLEVSRPVLAGPLLAAGCAIGNAGINPAAVYVGEQGGDLTIELIAEVEDAAPAPWPNLIRRGISFTPLLAATGPGPYALGNLQQLDGESIGRHTLVRGAGGSLALHVELEDEVAGISVSTAGGDFDGDGLLDVASMLLVPSLNQDDDQARVFTALGATLEGTRLAGQSDALAPDAAETQRFLDSELFAADLDGDGFDELIIASRNLFRVISLEP